MTTVENIQIETTTEVANIDTIDLQQFSVMQFMLRLGYTLYKTDRNGLVFVNGMPGKMERRMISFNTAIRMHNCGFEYAGDGTQVKSGDPLVSTYVDTYLATQALAAKVIEKAKLQYSKKQKRIILVNEPSKLVKFTNPVYATTFLGLPMAAPTEAQQEVVGE